MILRAEANRPRHHSVTTSLDADGEAVHTLSADVWPGDTVDLKMPNGLVLYMKVGPDGSVEFR